MSVAAENGRDGGRMGLDWSQGTDDDSGEEAR